MKIALITWNFNKSGGIERCVYEIATELIKRNHEVHIYCSKQDLIKIEGASYHIVPCFNKYFILKAISFFVSSYFVYKYTRNIKYDITHLHNPSFLVPSVFTVHSVHRAGIKYHERHLSLCQIILSRLRTLYPIIIYLSVYNLNKNKSRVVAISKIVAEEVRWVTNKKDMCIDIIYHGVNEIDYNYSDSIQKDLKNKLLIAENEKIILFVANEYGRKGLNNLLNAFYMLNVQNVKLLIVGESNDGVMNTKDAKILVSKLGLSQKCIFVGRSRNVEQYYSIADIFVLPTEYEPLGMVYMEAMCASIPIIVSEIAGVAEIITDKVEGFIHRMPITPETLCKLIYYLLSNDQLRKSMGTKGREKMKQFSWNRAVQEYEALYLKILFEAK